MRYAKRFFSFCVALVMLLNISVVASATDIRQDSTVNHSSDNYATLKIQDENVHDSYTFFDAASNEFISILRIIHPDGTTNYFVDSGSNRITGTSQRKEDYEYYYDIAKSLEEGMAPSSRATGKEVSGIHYYYTTIYRTLEPNQLAEAIYQGTVSGASSLAAYLAGLGLFGSVMVGFLTGFIMSISPNTRYDRLEIIQANYEVRSQWDGSYVCHCVHITTTLYLYDVNDNLESAPPEYDYVQTIGGI